MNFYLFMELVFAKMRNLGSEKWGYHFAGPLVVLVCLTTPLTKLLHLFDVGYSSDTSPQVAFDFLEWSNFQTMYSVKGTVSGA